ncbi:MAG: hypothetical protein KA131_08635 [Thauera sp.]|nr:hypothetical protein [Thauera sp.]
MKYKLASLAAIIAAHTASVCAANDTLTVSGFGTLGAVVTHSDDLQFRRVGVEAPSTKSVDFAPDSVMGVQTNFRLGDSAEAVLQVVSRESPKNNYLPRASLAFLSYSPSPESTLRMGRLRLPIFMLSDSIDINYAHPWVRPPVEVYGLSPFSDLDGIDFFFRRRIKDVDVELHPYLGRSRIDIIQTGHSSLSHLRGLNIGLSSGALTLHAGYARARLDMRWGDPFTSSLLDALHATPSGERIIAEMQGSDAATSFTSAGFQWDGERWLLIGEYAARRAAAFANSANGWHLTVGRHIGPFTPYLKFARTLQTSPIISDQFTAGQPALQRFNASRNGAQRSFGAGLRWDLRRDAAFKMEFARTRTENDSWGAFFPSRDGATTRVGDRTINTLSVSIDVVF